METSLNRPLEDKISLPTKTQRVWMPGGVGRPPRAASGHRPSLVHCLVGPDVRWSVPGLGWSIWSSLWASFACVTQRQIICAMALRLLSIFALFRVWVSAIQDSPKLVEIVSNKPYNYIW